MVVTNIEVGTEFVEFAGRPGTVQWRTVWKVIELKTFGWVLVQPQRRYEREYAECTYRTNFDIEKPIKFGQVNANKDVVLLRTGRSVPTPAYKILNPYIDPFSSQYCSGNKI